MGSCEIIANYHQLPTIGFHQESLYFFAYKAGIFSISLNPPEGLLQARSYIREETTSAA